MQFEKVVEAPRGKRPALAGFKKVVGNANPYALRHKEALLTVSPAGDGQHGKTVYLNAALSKMIDSSHFYAAVNGDLLAFVPCAAGEEGALQIKKPGRGSNVSGGVIHKVIKEHFGTSAQRYVYKFQFEMDEDAGVRYVYTDLSATPFSKEVKKGRGK